MLTTDCKFLENELFDAARLFKQRPTAITHAFRYENGVFYNAFEIDGEKFSFEDKAEIKNELEFKRWERRFAKLRLYEILSEKYGEKMPWGALTGIRPTKLAYSTLEEGRDTEKLFKQMHVSEENIRLVQTILQTQQGIYQKKNGNTDYFVSLPFCPSKCAYCSFITAPIEKTRGYLPAYLTCLEREIEASKDYIGNLRSIYVGGGTPFALDAPDLERVLKSLAPILETYNKNAEYTVEAGRPDVFTDEKLALLKEYGVTRICINPQTFSNDTLKAIGRKHTVEDFYKAYALSEKYGFSVNIDLIAGLEGESVETFVLGVESAIKTGADNITVHCLSLKAGATLKEKVSYILNDFISTMVGASREILQKNGYLPYYMYRQKYQAGNNENVGWTKPNKACVYNIDVMEEIADNLAVGANAISKRVDNESGLITRLGSAKDLPTYIGKIDELLVKKKNFFQ